MFHDHDFLCAHESLQLADAQAIEDETEEAMDSMDRTRCEGALDTLVYIYNLTYQLSFAIGARNEASR